MAKKARNRWRGFGEQARRAPRRRSAMNAPALRNGEYPMTGPQKTYLRNLCRRYGVKFDDSLTKAQASREIERLARLG